jgi:hypothetical protein
VPGLAGRQDRGRATLDPHLDAAVGDHDVAQRPVIGDHREARAPDLDLGVAGPHPEPIARVQGDDVDPDRAVLEEHDLVAGPAGEGQARVGRGAHQAMGQVGVDGRATRDDQERGSRRQDRRARGAPPAPRRRWRWRLGAKQERGADLLAARRARRGRRELAGQRDHLGGASELGATARTRGQMFGPRRGRALGDSARALGRRRTPRHRASRSIAARIALRASCSRRHKVPSGMPRARATSAPGSCSRSHSAKATC